MKCIFHKKLYEYRAIILDMDGTLYYHFPLKICMAFELLCYYTAHINQFKDLIRLIMFRISREAGIISDEDSVIDYWMQEKPLKFIRLFKDKRLLGLMQYLHSQGIKIAVYSDYPVDKKIEALQPFNVDFSFHAADSAIQCLKPDVKGLKYIVKVIKEPVENILFIGDRYDKDGKCAESIGMDYIILYSDLLRRNLFYRSVRNEYH
jgi:HAD superfamily hydrolase (TIGR01549 family)